MVLFVLTILGYLIGSIPTAIWLGKKVNGIDIREHGSKNAGATNTFRVFGKKLGWTVLIIDVLKGTLASSLPLFFSQYYTGFKDEQLILQLTTAFAAVFGHVFPIFAEFRGGKGVATSLGIVIGINPMAAGICLLIFLIVFLVSRFVSLGAICAAILFPLVSYYIVGDDTRIMIIFTIVLSSLVVVAHRNNISRLLKGEENKMNLLKKKA
jgi:glycerol-3-phosphate acyltransferase PlsY